MRHPFEVQYDLERAILAQGKNQYRCVESISGKGIEVGDKCIKTETHMIPMVRHFPEFGGNKPFNQLKIEEIDGFKFININD